MGGKRKGKGRGKGARKKRRQMEEGDEPPKKKGNEKAAAKEAAKAAAEAARREEELKDEERRRKAAARRAKPGFSKLLEAFGVSQQPSEDEGSDGSEGSEDEEDEAEAEGPEGPEGQDGEEGGPDVSQLMEAGEGEEEEIFEDADPEEDDEEEEEPVDLSGEQDSGLDFFERFWEDPPQALDKKSSGSTARATGVARFRLPELDRCEAHSCEVEALVKSLESGGKTPVPETLSKSWSYFRLAPGLRKNWEALLDALKDQKDFSLGRINSAPFLESLHRNDCRLPTRASASKSPGSTAWTMAWLPGTRFRTHGHGCHGCHGPPKLHCPLNGTAACAQSRGTAHARLRSSQLQHAARGTSGDPSWAPRGAAATAAPGNSHHRAIAGGQSRWRCEAAAAIESRCCRTAATGASCTRTA